MKVVINTCFGGFGLSEEAMKYLGAKNSYEYINDRTNPKLVECVETLGDEADRYSSCLKVVEIPDDVEWEIYNYDGKESIHEKHRVWC